VLNVKDVVLKNKRNVFFVHISKETLCDKTFAALRDLARQVLIAWHLNLFVFAKLCGVINALHQQPNAILIGDVKRNKLHQIKIVQLKREIRLCVGKMANDCVCVIPVCRVHGLIVESVAPYSCPTVHQCDRHRA